jgi:hypothetical protein
MALQPFVGPWQICHFLDLFTQTVGLLGRGISPSEVRCLHTNTDYTQTSMLQVEFEPTIPVFERAKTIYASDREATVIGHSYI